MTTTRAAVFGRIFAAVLVCAAAVTAQEPAPTPGAESPAAGAAGSPAAAARYLRIDADDVPLRCFATEQSPAYDERLSVGDVVRTTGTTNGDYVEIELPLGVIGYVHAGFVEAVGDAAVKSKARLSFRYSPGDRRAPVAFVDPGHEFLLVSRDGDWLRVRNPGQTAWIPSSAGVPLGAEAALPAWTDLEQRQRAAIAAVAAQAAAERAAKEAAAALTTRADAIRQQIDVEVAKPDDSEDWGPIVEAATAFRGEVQETGGALAERFGPIAGALVADAERNQKVAELLRETRAGPKPVTDVYQPPRPGVNPMQPFDATGWMRFERGTLFGDTVTTIEKGGQTSFRLVCSSGRYDLSMFDDLEVAVRGRIDRPDPADTRVLDVERIVVIGRSLR
ncbi:MAG: hypothetical protein IPM29_16660 [Planctomycetes bacterium]|nr:hypothetical protein [Planctomycetota bacterium]